MVSVYLAVITFLKKIFVIYLHSKNKRYGYFVQFYWVRAILFSKLEISLFENVDLKMISIW